MWTALTSSTNFVLESLETFAESTGVAALFEGMGWGNVAMIAVAFVLLYLLGIASILLVHSEIGGLCLVLG